MLLLSKTLNSIYLRSFFSINLSAKYNVFEGMFQIDFKTESSGVKYYKYSFVISYNIELGEESFLPFLRPTRPKIKVPKPFFK